jgi:hypothetical protein
MLQYRGKNIDPKQKELLQNKIYNYFNSQNTKIKHSAIKMFIAGAKVKYYVINMFFSFF